MRSVQADILRLSQQAKIRSLTRLNTPTQSTSVHIQPHTPHTHSHPLTKKQPGRGGAHAYNGNAPGGGGAGGGGGVQGAAGAAVAAAAAAAAGAQVAASNALWTRSFSRW